MEANAAGSDVKTTLHNVVVHGLYLDLMYLLLSAGGDIDARTAEGFTALHLAAERSDSGGMTAFPLRLGSAKGALLRNGRCPLYLEETSCALLAAGEDARLRDAKRRYATITTSKSLRWTSLPSVARSRGSESSSGSVS